MSRPMVVLCSLASLLLAGLVSSVVLVPRANVPTITTTTTMATPPPTSATPPPTVVTPTSVTPPPSTTPPPTPVIPMKACTCRACDDYRDEGACILVPVGIDCSSGCLPLGCPLTSDSEPPCPTGACCRLNEADIIATQRDCRFLHDGTYAGDGVADCDETVACCLEKTGAPNVCINGYSALECLSLREATIKTLASAGACELSSEPCIVGGSPRANLNACCQLAGACSSDVAEATCEDALQFKGVYTPGFACDPNGLCVSPV